MTAELSGVELAREINARFPVAVLESDEKSVTVHSGYLLEVMGYLKNTRETTFNYLADLTAVDYYDYLEVLYRLVSLERNQSVVLKTHCIEPDRAVLPSVTALWKGADLMEREVFDLMGITFRGHPNLKRIFMWEGFEGNPLRKNFG